MYNWRDRQPLNKDKLLATAEEVAIELANLHNETITDEEQSEDEYFETNNITTVLRAENLDNKNTNYEMQANIEIENNTPTAASEFSESKKSKRIRKAVEELKRKWKKKEITTNINFY
ncbi:hypothetical protein QE152_g19870 [Popillia japonica]|uniref:Uncharacterized protein n=1 Tax=Popillia japonica TaxID=7064 RepID=A0AAW1KP34_POPJA